MNKKKFGFIEMIGSVVMVLLDPVRTNNKKYLNEKYYKLNRIVGVITIIVILLITLYFIANYF